MTRPHLTHVMNDEALAKSRWPEHTDAGDAGGSADHHPTAPYGDIHVGQGGRD
jgi:hypothetical protein